MSEKNTARQAINKTGVVDGLTEEELGVKLRAMLEALLERLYRKKNKAFATEVKEKWQAEINQANEAYNQLVEIVKESFHTCITIDLDNLCMDKITCNYLKKTGIKVVKHIVEQQRAKVSRAFIKKLCWVIKGSIDEAYMRDMVQFFQGEGVEVGE